MKTKNTDIAANDAVMSAQDEEVLPDARRYKDFNAVVSPKESEAEATKRKRHKSWVSLAVIIVLGLISIWGVSHYVTYGSKVGASFEASDCDPVTHTRLEGKVPSVYKGNIKKYEKDGGRVDTVNCLVQTAK